MELFEYIPVIIGIRNDDFSPLITPRTITENNKRNLHVRVLSKLRNDGYPCGLVFQNELYVTRSLRDLTNNEIHRLITTNTTWDMIILSDCPNTSLQAVPGYEILKKSADTSTFKYTSIYLASARLMEKAHLGNLTDLQVYVYSDPFLANIETSCKSNKYTVGRVTNIKLLGIQDVKYAWHDYGV
jgi:hypothetical protein